MKIQIPERFKEYITFTKNEQKIFIFLALVFLAGISIRAYRLYIVPETPAEFDYSAEDSLFAARSQTELSPGQEKQQVIAQGKINLNSASKQQIELLPGVGPSLADRILQYRNEKGKFSTVDELRKVKGIGAKKFESIKPLVIVQ